MTQELPAEAVIGVIRGALEKSFGREAARAVDFYFDTKMAVADPEGYTKMLRKTFLAGADPLVETITVELCLRYNVDHPPGMTLSDCIEAIRGRDGTSAA